ncbi:acylphosphatase [Nitratireductor sp. ZSWI3]|uniref:acylphosphatase n=1 Tax=Nitratireductor sp. ZSWI3 TaxID=2966359 RepID=UPI00214FD973|nr:acylphosphatase [Nitratireductor sp. ZSWI3]MCR4267910.1 acylphosphatase [Nitratireductor sp. ZSWI3]
MAMVAVSARITGRVQGVAFRAWTRAEALRHGLSGWVRNEPDGSVRALIVGAAPDVAAMVRALGNGPPAARVTNVTTETVEPDPAIAGFRIVR